MMVLGACAIDLDPNQYQIVFTTQNRFTSGDLYIVNADGTGLYPLTRGSPNDVQPVWSPDGTRIAFLSDRSTHNYSIFVINSDGKGLTGLATDLTSNAKWPKWSPDGTRIAFNSFHSGNHDIAVINADGSELTYVTNDLELDNLGSWSANSAQIAFVHYREHSSDIYVVNADGSDLSNLTNHPADYGLPQWSPDGKYIAFSSNRDDPNYDTCSDYSPPLCNSEIYIMNADGTGLTRLTFHSNSDYEPRWSPDSLKLVFVSYRDEPYPGTCEGMEHSPNRCNTEIYTINIDGTRLTNVTNHLAYDSFPEWSPDGKKIAFYSNRDDHSTIYSMNADGTEVTLLTQNLNNAAHLDWGYWQPWQQSENEE